MKLDLVGMAEIAEMLGYGSRQGADYAIRRAPDFPEPVADVSAGRIWRRSDVRQWISKHPEVLDRAGGTRPAAKKRSPVGKARRRQA